MKTTAHPNRPHVDRLGINFQACRETIASVVDPDDCADPRQSYLLALQAAQNGDWLIAMRETRASIVRGVDPGQTSEVVAMIHEGIAADLKLATPGLAAELFRPSALAMVRWLQAKIYGGPAFGIETEVIVRENRPLAEIREVFARPFLADVPVDVGQGAHLDKLLQTANDITAARECRAQAIVSTAAIALAADDFLAAVRLVAFAVRLAPSNISVGIAASFVWLAICAAGRDGKFAGTMGTPDWLDIVDVLTGALGYEARHSPRRREGVRTALQGRQSS